MRDDERDKSWTEHLPKKEYFIDGDYSIEEDNWNKSNKMKDMEKLSKEYENELLYAIDESD